MLESTKEGLTGLPEGSDIGLGAGDRAFEPRYSDQNPTPRNENSAGWGLCFIYA